MVAFHRVLYTSPCLPRVRLNSTSCLLSTHYTHKSNKKYIKERALPYSGIYSQYLRHLRSVNAGDRLGRLRAEDGRREGTKLEA
jgi:hypothetical protein